MFKKKGVTSTILIFVVVAIIVAVSFGVYHFLLSEESTGGSSSPETSPIGLDELYGNYDNSAMKFQSYNPGDSIQVKVTITKNNLVPEGTWLITQENGIAPNGDKYKIIQEFISLPATVIGVSESNPITPNVPPHLVLKGNKTDNYTVGENITVKIEVKKARYFSKSGESKTVEIAKQWSIQFTQ